MLLRSGTVNGDPPLGRASAHHSSIEMPAVSQ